MATQSDEPQWAALGVRKLAADSGYDDLILPQQAKELLGRAVSWIARPGSLFREAGLGRYIDGGFRALFRGPSGTGKTMAAIAIATDVERDLYQVDLAAVTGKHAGETERNLRAIFDLADRSGAILLFDEADALFGKRSEVKDAHDRFANIEVAYLLRRLEAFDGLAILTTNRRLGLSDDVLGRIDLLIDFPRPDEEARAMIWRRTLDSLRVPRGDVDLRSLAAHDLTGGEILKSVRMAALVAGIDQRSVDTAMLQAAARERLAMREQPEQP